MGISSGFSVWIPHPVCVSPTGRWSCREYPHGAVCGRGFFFLSGKNLEWGVPGGVCLQLEKPRTLFRSSCAFSLPPNRAGVCSIVSPTLRITAPSVRQSDVCWCLIGGFLGDFHMTDNTKRLLCAHHPITLVCSYHPCVSLLGRLSFC